MWYCDCNNVILASRDLPGSNMLVGTSTAFADTSIYPHFSFLLYCKFVSLIKASSIPYGILFTTACIVSNEICIITEISRASFPEVE